MAYKAHNDYDNQAVLNSLEPGDRVEFERTFYSHWGIYIGDGEIIHVKGNKGEKAEVKRESFWNAVKDGLAKKNNSKDADWRPLEPEDIVERAKWLIGKWEYDVVSENCEHLVNWCRYDVKVSEQVDNFIENMLKLLVAAGSITLVTVGGVAIYKSCQPKKEKK
ncbi:unnamed protein product [Candidula unifasciata]|uniref:LRAT domain-containing protein n=1 Tax=Candidula unifasciata TaxID=100452 RepID=A0A8S3ZM30_9EUPU|nr:unnamed protein product [Candidula unifasciata]